MEIKRLLARLERLLLEEPCSKNNFYESGTKNRQIKGQQRDFRTEEKRGTHWSVSHVNENEKTRATSLLSGTFPPPINASVSISLLSSSQGSFAGFEANLKANDKRGAPISAPEHLVI